MTINVSIKTKSLSIDCYTLINFDDVDFDKNMIFVWRNKEIVASVVIPMLDEVYIYFWIDDSKCKSFNKYEDFRKFYNEYKNLV